MTKVFDPDETLNSLVERVAESAKTIEVAYADARSGADYVILQNAIDDIHVALDALESKFYDVAIDGVKQS